MGWEGRQLKSAGKNGTNLSFTYDSEGIRTSKTVGSTTTKYLINGTQINKKRAWNFWLYCR